MTNCDFEKVYELHGKYRSFHTQLSENELVTHRFRDVKIFGLTLHLSHSYSELQGVNLLRIVYKHRVIYINSSCLIKQRLNNFVVTKSFLSLSSSLRR